MYSVNDKDRVVELDDLPQCSIGAPCPILLAGEGDLVVAYLLQAVPDDWDGRTVRVLSALSSGEPAALVRFTHPYASMFGPPNDEAFAGHPLASRGLEPYGAFEVLESSWIRRLERMNAVHPCHRPEHFTSYRHLVLSFHDTTFECIAKGYTSEITTSPLADRLADQARNLKP